jgi:hypothetical protein
MFIRNVCWHSEDCAALCNWRLNSLVNRCCIRLLVAPLDEICCTPLPCGMVTHPVGCFQNGVIGQTRGMTYIIMLMTFTLFGYVIACPCRLIYWQSCGSRRQLTRNGSLVLCWVVTALTFWTAKESEVRGTFFVVIPFYLQSVPVHSANCVKPYTVACRRVFSSSPLELIGPRPLVAFVKETMFPVGAACTHSDHCTSFGN